MKCAISCCLALRLVHKIIIRVVLDLSGLTLQSGPSRLVKDEYTAGVVPAPAAAAPGHMDVDGSNLHHAPPQKFAALPAYTSGNGADRLSGCRV